ncbi:MAG: hypothetical protein HYU30_00390 [Chloroflexi bacterium]|nr:hypothetical protein [Chloroflexota bacterium]
MIILRRILAVLLLILFIPLFLAIIAAAQVNSTLLNAGFYVAQLRKADPFNFTYDRLLPAAFDQATRDAGLPVDPARVKEKAVTLARTTLPPEWLEEQAEAALLQVVPYLTGDRDQFAITLPLREPIENLGEGIKALAADPDTYILILDEGLAPQLDEALKKAGGLPLGIQVKGPDLVEAIKKVLSQEWVEGLVVLVVDQAVPYATGESEHLLIVVPIGDRIEAAAPALKALLANSGVYTALERQEFRDALGRQLDAFGALPFGLSLTADQIASAAAEVATPPWLQTQTEAILDAAVPYLVGRQDTFVVAIPLKDRVIAAVPVAKELLRESGAYEKAFDQVVQTLLDKGMSGAIPLPLGITVTPEEVRPVLRAALPPEFVQQQAEAMIDEVAPYLVGDRATFRIVVPLEQPKEQALATVEALVVQKARQRWESLPPCSLSQAVDLLKQASLEAIPSCRPAGFTLAQMKEALGIPAATPVTVEDIATQLGVESALLTQGVAFQWLVDTFGGAVSQQLRQFVGGAIPSQFIYTDADLRKTLGPDHEKRMDDVLGWIRNGYRFTDAELRGRLNTDQQEILDGVLRWTREGFRYTDVDLRNAISADGTDADTLETYDRVLGYTRSGYTFTQEDLRRLMDGSADSTAFDDFDRARQTLGRVRGLRFLVYLAVALLLAGIAFLGGRGWRGRLAWGSAALGLAAFLGFILFGVVYGAVAWPLIDDAISRAVQEAQEPAQLLQRLTLEKGREVARSLSDAIVGGMARRSLVFLLIAALGALAAIFWPRLAGAVKRS